MTDAQRFAETMTEARTKELLGHTPDRNDVTDLLWMISTAVGYARRYRESERHGPDDIHTHAFRDLAEQLQRGL